MAARGGRQKEPRGDKARRSVSEQWIGCQGHRHLAPCSGRIPRDPEEKGSGMSKQRRERDRDDQRRRKRLYLGSGMSKQRRERERDVQRRRKHLYLVLDDWRKGFSIHKVDMAAGASSGAGQGLRHLPESAALRIVTPDRSRVFFSAVGSDIFIATEARRVDPEPPILVFDTQAAALAVGPRLPAQLLGHLNLVVPDGEMLYMLAYHRKGHSDSESEYSFDSSDEEWPESYDYSDGGWEHSFAAISSSRSWHSLPSPPFGPEELVGSSAVHPDERTIFMTTYSTETETLDHKGTYSFDTKNHVWAWHGEWALPFQGRGYFDADLDAWVGLHVGGYICSCPIPSPTATHTNVLDLDWVKGKERLFCKNPGRPSKATLACMGRNKFCLVETVVRDGLDLDCHIGVDGYVIHLTMFSLRHDKTTGDLQANIYHPTRSYLMTRYLSSFPLVSFWM